MSDLPTHGRFEGRTHLLPIRVYYEDTDFTGLVYHGSYVRFLERGRSDFLKAIGVGHADLLADDRPTAFVVAELSLRYLTPARIDDALVVRTAYEALRGPRLIIRQAIVRGEARLCEAAVTAVCIRLDGRPVRPPVQLAAKVTPWLSPASGVDG